MGSASPTETSHLLGFCEDQCKKTSSHVVVQRNRLVNSRRVNGAVVAIGDVVVATPRPDLLLLKMRDVILRNLVGIRRSAERIEKSYSAKLDQQRLIVLMVLCVPSQDKVTAFRNAVLFVDAEMQRIVCPVSKRPQRCHVLKLIQCVDLWQETTLTLVCTCPAAAGRATGRCSASWIGCTQR